MPKPFLKTAPQEFMWPPSGEELERRGFDVSDGHLLGLNEVTESPSPRVCSALAEHWAQAGRYPEAGTNQLRDMIAERTGTPPACQIWTAGMSDLLLRLMITVRTQDGCLVMQSPNFWGYEKLAQAVGTRVFHVPLQTTGPTAGAADVDGLINAISSETTVVTITTPCNPTGVSVSEDDLQTLARSVPDDVLLFVDEAYHEFALHAGQMNALEVVRNARPDGLWVVGRTFSKAYALAGARIAYALTSDARTANYIRNHASEFNVSRYAQVAATAALPDTEHQQAIMRRCAEQRENLLSGLAAMSLYAYPSVTNFVSVQLPRPATGIVAAMAEKGVYVARWMEPGYEHMLRLSVGTPADTEATLGALSQALDA